MSRLSQKFESMREKIRLPNMLGESFMTHSVFPKALGAFAISIPNMKLAQQVKDNSPLSADYINSTWPLTLLLPFLIGTPAGFKVNENIGPIGSIVAVGVPLILGGLSVAEGVITSNQTLLSLGFVLSAFATGEFVGACFSKN